MLTEQQVSEVLSRYPDILSLGGRFKDIINCGNSNNEFVLKDILEKESEPYWNAFLTRLNNFIKSTSKIYLSKKKLRNKIYSSPFSTMWELEFANYCTSQNISIIPEEKTVGNSNVDFKISLAGSDVLVECHARRLKKKEEKEHVAIGDITRDLANTVTGKQNENEIPSDLKMPLILAIDGNYAGVDPINVESFFNFRSKEFHFVSAIFLKHTGSYTIIQNTYSKNSLTAQQINELTTRV
ncbi:hypothetical protein EPN87_02815 [archaeon]|nr:MAG: hypothetical protein EPN87_02815 [archaeon]